MSFNYDISAPRFSYWRCLRSEGSEEFTLVKATCADEKLMLIKSFFSVEFEEETLPEWRLISLEEAIG